MTLRLELNEDASILCQPFTCESFQEILINNCMLYNSSTLEWGMSLMSFLEEGQGHVSIYRPSYLRMAISMLKIRRPLGRLIFNMRIAIPGKTVFLIETAPRTRLACTTHTMAADDLANHQQACYLPNPHGIFRPKCHKSSFPIETEVDTHSGCNSIPSIPVIKYS